MLTCSSFFHCEYFHGETIWGSFGFVFNMQQLHYLIILKFIDVLWNILQIAINILSAVPLRYSISVSSEFRDMWLYLFFWRRYVLSTQWRPNLSCMEHIPELFWVWCFFKCGTTSELIIYLLLCYHIDQLIVSVISHHQIMFVAELLRLLIRIV